MIQAFGLTSNPRKAHPPAVDDVSFEAHAGHVTVLLGGAGAGKTTTLRLMLELQQGRGITYFRGRPLHRIAHPAREVGVLLGDVPGHPARSVRGHLRMLCAASGVPARRADEVLEVVGLVSFREERLGTLSRGMDRRLGLACALLPDPHTLVLDEPAGGLSVREAQWLHDTLRAHAGQGGTVLLTTADPKEAARRADRVVTLDGGRIVADQVAGEFARTRLRPRVAVRSPQAARLATLLAKEARTARRSVEVVREGGNHLSVYGTTTADVGETAFRHGILVHQLADEIGDMGPGSGTGASVSSAEPTPDSESETPAELEHAGPGPSATEPEPSVRGLPTVDAGASGLALAASASGIPTPGSSVAESGAPVLAESGAPALDASVSEPAPAASGLASGEPGTIASGSSGRERATLPFGFSVGVRESGPAQTPAGLRAVSGASSGEEPPAGERARALSGEQPSLRETCEPGQGTAHTEPVERVPAEGAPLGDATPGTGGRTIGDVGPVGEDALDGGAAAVPAEVLVGADGGRTADAAATTDAGGDAASAAQEPQTGAASTMAPGISGLSTRLPGARRPGTGQPQATGAARPEGVRSPDPLSPLPPPIPVRPAPSPLRPLRYEIRRAAGIGVGFVTCGAVLAVSALTAVLLARIGHTPQARLFAAWPRELPLPPAALAAGLLGALAFGDEFRHPALAADRGTVPRRLGLLTAKLLVSGATAAMLAFLTVGCDAEALYIVYGRELTQVPADWLSLGASWFCLIVGCAWAGVLAAGVFRSTTGGLAAVLAVPVVVVPLVHEVMHGPALRLADGFPVRMRELLLLQWPFGGERYLLGMARVFAQPVGSALVLSLSALLCAYLFTTLRTRFR
ncbi:Vitamin B12 import ATP-binding protein BtuD [Streptomyces sp. RB17]|uniref:ATP-binding cassette domain-containing protein n=1 Tax=Streptomyces sp. RB17 TaxID=2585197 RepID=UPI00130C15E7|nr:ATP-binding cassette domain-containing protein [Streptomyces sp. RB17]MQY38364.1 Vitamin B12 import ATP-binding protein BtuD [Streptomyces sp. RB17]